MVLNAKSSRNHQPTPGVGCNNLCFRVASPGTFGKRKNQTDQAFHQPYRIIKNRYIFQHLQADKVTTQMLILKVYAKEILHLGLFQPWETNNSLCNCRCCWFWPWVHKGTERLFLSCPQIKALITNSGDIWISRYDSMNSFCLNSQQVNTITHSGVRL